MPAFKETVAVITTFVVLATASGHGEWVWKGLVILRHHALTEAKKDWGCPSIFRRSACMKLDSKGGR